MGQADRPLFALGRVVATPGALDTFGPEGVAEMARYIRRHHTGDWGDLGAEDKRMNDAAVQSGDARIFSAYVLPGDIKIWIITEADRASTAVLLPSEY